MHTTIVGVSESEPVCGTNISLPDYAVDVSDHIEIMCSVTFNGMWTPVFVCAPDSPGTNITIITNQTSSRRVLHHRVIAAADIDDFQILSCSLIFTLAANNRQLFPDMRSEPENPVYDFIWNTSSIRIVNASGKCRYLYKVRLTVINYATHFRSILDFLKQRAAAVQWLLHR